MYLTVAICDDLEEERLRLFRMLQSYSQRKGIDWHIELYESGNHFASSVGPGRWDMVLLDIHMDGINGIEAAERLRSKDRSCILIFVTISQEHGLKSYALKADDYLVKPVKQSRLDESLDWCLKKHCEDLRTICVHSDCSAVEIPIRYIVYVESRQHYSFLYISNGCIRTRVGINSLEIKIGSKNFLRCHRCYLINMRHVRRLERQNFIMDNMDSVPVTTRDYDALKQDFIKWVLKQNWRNADSLGIF